MSSLFNRLWGAWCVLTKHSYYVVASSNNEAQIIHSQDAVDIAIRLGAFYKVLNHRLDDPTIELTVETLYRKLIEEEV